MSQDLRNSEEDAGRLEERIKEMEEEMNHDRYSSVEEPGSSTVQDASTGALAPALDLQEMKEQSVEEKVTGTGDTDAAAAPRVATQLEDAITKPSEPAVAGPTSPSEATAPTATVPPVQSAKKTQREVVPNEKPPVKTRRSARTAVTQAKRNAAAAEEAKKQVAKKTKAGKADGRRASGETGWSTC